MVTWCHIVSKHGILANRLHELHQTKTLEDEVSQSGGGCKHGMLFYRNPKHEMTGVPTSWLFRSERFLASYALCRGLRPLSVLHPVCGWMADRGPQGR
jgi:hypothetical protein